jgi:NADH dehydrogenase
MNFHKNFSKTVIIIGGGFGGLRAAKTLANKKDLSVKLIDQHNYHLFQPLLYQVATAGLSPADIAVPIRSVVGTSKNIEVLLGKVDKINIKDKKIYYDNKELNYDYLIVASGARHSYFTHPEWEVFAPGLKTLEHATEIRKNILLAYEKAEIESDEKLKGILLTFVIVGGGPTGVELAGAIAEISRQTLVKDFKNIDPTKTKIILIEAGPRILAAFHPSLSFKAKQDLNAMGVQVMEGARVTKVELNSVNLESQIINAFTVIWAAGVKPSELGQYLGNEHDPLGRVVVNKTLNISDHPEVFVIGDLAYFKNDSDKPLPGMAPVALQQGELAAENILNAIQHKKYEEFIYKEKGMMATIGRKKAILEFHQIRISGFVAWLAWLIVHIIYLIDFKNKLVVFLNWCWSYITLRKGARLIIGTLNNKNSIKAPPVEKSL